MIAFIDDDEFPEVDWLFNHFRTLEESQASGILGPVRAHLDQQAPVWLAKSGLLERREFATEVRLTNAIPGPETLFSGNLCLPTGRTGSTRSMGEPAEGMPYSSSE